MAKNKVTKDSFEDGMINIVKQQKHLDVDFTSALDELFCSKKKAKTKMMKLNKVVKNVKDK